MSTRIIGFFSLTALLIIAVACGNQEVQPLPTSLAGFDIGAKFEPDGPEWRQTNYGDTIIWQKQQGQDAIQVACDKNGKIVIITENLYLYNRTTKEGDESLIQKYLDEIWNYKQVYKSLMAGKDRAGNEVFVGDDFVMTVNIYQEAEDGPTRYVKTIKTRAVYEDYARQQ